MWSDPLGLACSKKVDALRNGPQKIVAKVKTKKEANELLSEAFPNAQKIRGIGSQKRAKDSLRRKPYGMGHYSAELDMATSKTTT